MWLCNECARFYPDLKEVGFDEKRPCDHCRRLRITWQFERPGSAKKLIDITALISAETWSRALKLPIEIVASSVRNWASSLELVVIFLVIMNILLGIGFWVHGYVVVLQYPSQVQGKVLKLEMENRISSSSCRGSLGLCSREAYYLTYEYAPMGTTDVYQQEVRVSWLYYRKFSVDQPITIRYMPHDPERSHLNEIDFIFQVLAGSAILLGIAILFAKISFRKRHRPNPV